MLTPAPVAVVTGASGYLGSQICDTLESSGWHVVRLARSPGKSHGQTLCMTWLRRSQHGYGEALR